MPLCNEPCRGKVLLLVENQQHSRWGCAQYMEAAMRELRAVELTSVEGGGAIALAATAAWLWANRGALSDIANKAGETMSDLEAEDKKQ